MRASFFHPQHEHRFDDANHRSAISTVDPALMGLAYLPTIRAYELPPSAAFELALASLLYAATTVDSAPAHARWRGRSWNGRSFVMPSRK